MARSAWSLVLSFVFLAVPAFAGQPAAWVPRGAGGGGALFVPSFSPQNPDELYISSDMGELFHTTTLGTAWTALPYTQVLGGNGAHVAFTSNNLVRYCITNGSPCMSADGGNTWTVLAHDPTGGGCYSIFADPGSTSRLLVSSYSTLYFSVNGGSTFATVATESNFYIVGAYFNGTNIYVGTNSGLLVSTNGGSSFAFSTATGLSGEMTSLTGATSGAVTQLFCVTVAPGNTWPGIEETSIYGLGQPSGVYTLTVGGNWVQCNVGASTDVLALAGMAQNDPSVAYIAGQDVNGYPIIYKTTDGGNTWAQCLFVINNQNVSTGWDGDGGDRHWDYGNGPLGFAVSPINSSVAAWTDLGFCHVTSNGGTTWQAAYVAPSDLHPMNAPTPRGDSYSSVGLEDTSCWDLAWSNATNLFAGFTDIDAIRSTDGGVTWSFNFSGDTYNTMYRVVSAANGNLYAATSTIHDMYQSTHLTDSSIDSGSGAVLFSTNMGATWTTMYAAGHPVIWVQPDPANANRMYASVIHSTLGGIFVCNNVSAGASSTWTKLTNPPRTQGHPFNIRILNDGTLVCSYSGRYSGGFTASSGVFSSSDGGNTWQDFCAGTALQYWTQDVVIDPNDPAQNTWYAGVYCGWGGPPNGLGGLYKTTNRGQTWTCVFSQAWYGVTSCAFNPAYPAEMYVTTEGQGLWYSSNASAATPAFSPVTAYPFQQPERVIYNPYDTDEVWVTSFGNGLNVGTETGFPLSILTTSLPAGVVGRPYSQTFAVSGGALPRTWALSGGTLPAGLSLSAAGVLSGTPTAAGSTPLTVQVTDASSATASASFTLTINPVLSITTSPSLPSGVVGTPYAQTLGAGGGVPPYNWSLLSGTLAPGGTSLSLSAAGVISGTPALSGASNFTVQVADTTGALATQAYVLTINAAPTILTPPLPQTVNPGAPVSFTVAATGTAPLAYQWRLNGQNISGATTATYALAAAQFSATGTYSVAVSNLAGAAISAGAYLNVLMPPWITTPPLSQAVPPGQSVTFTVAASGSIPFSYQWSRNGAVLAGAVSAAYSTGPLALSDNNATFTVLVSNTVGSVLSAPATLWVSATPRAQVQVQITCVLQEDTVGICWAAGTAGKMEGDITPLSWALGSVPLGTLRTTNTGGTDRLPILVRNSGTVAAQIAVQGANSAAWQLSPAAGTDEFELGVNAQDNSSYTALTLAPAVLANPPAGQAQTLYLYFKAPLESSTSEEQEVAVTIIANEE